MFRLEKDFRFEASHVLEGHDGKCARLHGHSWLGRLVVEGNDLRDEGPQRNMLVDFSVLKRIADDICEALDHRHLNDVLRTSMPTSEFVARWCYERAAAKADEVGLPRGMIRGVVIEETCTSRCEYWPTVVVRISVP